MPSMVALRLFIFIIKHPSSLLKSHSFFSTHLVPGTKELTLKVLKIHLCLIGINYHGIMY